MSSSSKRHSIEPPHLVVSSPPSPTGSSRSGGTPKRSFSPTHSQINLVETRWKGKRRATDDASSEDITDTQYDSRASEEHTEDDGSEYPPMGDDELEERRVHETLKRWEDAERQRRKAARGSVRAAHSVVSGVSKRVSLLWSEATSTQPRPSRGSFKLDDSPEHETNFTQNLYSASPAPSRSSSARTAVNPPERRSSSPTIASPLVRLEYQEVSPFADGRWLANGAAAPLSPAPAVEHAPFMDPNMDPNMDPKSIPPTPTLEDDLLPTARPTLQTAEAVAAVSQMSTPSKVDPPKPNVGMQVRVPSDIALLEEEEERLRDQEDGRWWMDWMCGCKESGGRGHGQAGRTNPFE